MERIGSAKIVIHKIATIQLSSGWTNSSAIAAIAPSALVGGPGGGSPPADHLSASSHAATQSPLRRSRRRAPARRA
eukprot:5255905-Prymnesium_polylepis.2